MIAVVIWSDGTCVSSRHSTLDSAEAAMAAWRNLGGEVYHAAIFVVPDWAAQVVQGEFGNWYALPVMRNHTIAAGKGKLVSAKQPRGAWSDKVYTL